MRKRVKKFFTVVIVLMLSLSTIFYAGMKMKLKEFSKEISKIEIKDLDMSRMVDGVYQGAYSIDDLVEVVVKVTIKDNKILYIDFVQHKNGKGKKAEAITNSVINAQSLQVDAISGATGSSRIILKAIENALEKAS